MDSSFKKFCLSNFDRDFKFSQSRNNYMYLIHYFYRYMALVKLVVLT